MRYYKLVNKDEFIGVVTEYNFRKFQKKNKILLVCDSREGQYVRLNDSLYRDRSWMAPLTTDEYEYTDIEVVNINEDNYRILSESIKTNDSLVTKPVIEEPIEELNIEIESIEEPMDNDQVTIDYVKNAKILEMNNMCHNTIISGFDIVLNDNISHHFSLSIEDQVNLLNAFILLDNGADKILYHANNETYRYFSKEDMALIINKANEIKAYNTTYCNSIKSYIQSLNDITTISNIKYGDELPKTYISNFI